jgi:hypothetical protein
MQTATSAMHADIEQKFGARMKQLEVAVASASQQERAALEAEAKAGDDTKKHIDAAHAPSLRAMRERQERARRGFAGPVGIVKIELPAAVLLFFVFLRIPGGTIVALICSILLGQWIRFLVRFSNARPQRAYDSAVASSEREQEARERAIQDRFAKARREQQSTLDSLSRERSKAIETINRKIAALRKPWDDQIVKVAAVHQEQAGPFRAQLVRKIKVKSESQKKEFPAYVAALCKGFKEGSGPSQSEMEMTTSEVSQARAMLRLY